MNKVILIGRLTRDVETRYSGEMAIARYTLAVERRVKKDSEQTADFINCVAFGKSGEFADKYFRKGMKVAITGRIQTGSYEKDGQRVYTTDIVVEEQEFGESKAQNTEAPNTEAPKISTDANGFMNIPDGADFELPFN